MGPIWCFKTAKLQLFEPTFWFLKILMRVFLNVTYMLLQNINKCNSRNVPQPFLKGLLLNTCLCQSFRGLSQAYQGISKASARPTKAPAKFPRTLHRPPRETAKPFRALAMPPKAQARPPKVQSRPLQIQSKPLMSPSRPHKALGWFLRTLARHLRTL